MKTHTIYEHKHYDRYILITKEDEKVINVDFMQGVFKDSLDALTTNIDEVNVHILEIFNRLVEDNKRNKKKDTLLETANEAVELYAEAFIFLGRNK
jgi:hypothetical protein